MPMNWRGNDYSSPNRYNIDGVLVYDQDRYGNTRSYTQLYRNGIIEAVEGGHYIQYGGIDIYSFEKQLRDSLRAYLEVLQLLEVDTPIFLFLTLLGVKDVVLLANSRKISSHAIDRDELDIPDTLSRVMPKS